MPEEIRDYLKELWFALRPADLLDMLVVALLAYAIIGWFRRSRSRFVMVGLALLTVVYLGARLLDMYLTLFLFQAGITIALVALVVIFQEEIRRGFERLATGRLLSQKASHSEDFDIIDTVVEACSFLANQKIGALIVLKGREPLERHLTGGVRLDGRITEPLLYSIFDPGSPGHDGAVLVEDGRIARFGVHLPLSTNVRGHEKFGTRHTAALGLVERSDALVVVVSEERGTISIARDGTLEALEGAAELKQRLEGFLSHARPLEPVSLWRRLFTHDLGAKILSVSIALIAWLIVFGYQREVVARTFDVPVVFRNVPEGWMFENPDPHEVRVTVSGTNRGFRLLDPEQLAVSLDVAEPERGWQDIALNEADLALPGDLTTENFDVESVRFEAYPTAKVRTAVDPRTTGAVPDHVRLKRVSVQPETVELIVRKQQKGKVEKVPTKAVDLSTIEQTQSVAVPLQLPQNARLAEGHDPMVSVTFQVAPAPKVSEDN